MSKQKLYFHVINKIINFIYILDFSSLYLAHTGYIQGSLQSGKPEVRKGNVIHFSSFSSHFSSHSFIILQGQSAEGEERKAGQENSYLTNGGADCGWLLLDLATVYIWLFLSQMMFGLFCKPQHHHRPCCISQIHLYSSQPFVFYSTP